ncbi:MAG: hypothetical protein ACUVUU_07830 [bacterium]
MGIRIARISVKNCGPIERLDQDLVDVNLIHGKNESGKSFLVEFLIRSLFEGFKQWNDLREGGTGRVLVEGIGEKPLEFSKQKRTKLENYIGGGERGLPASFARLLVVRGGEIEINPEGGDIDRDTIKDIFSPKRILDQIESKIQEVVKKARIRDGYIEIREQGEGRRYNEARRNLVDVDRAMDRASSGYVEGRIRELTFRQEELSQRKKLLISAKRFRAFYLSREIEKLKEEIGKTPDDMLDHMGDLLDEYTRLKERAESLHTDLSKIRDRSNDLPLVEERRKELLHAKRHKAFLLKRQIEDEQRILEAIPEEDLRKIEVELEKYFDLRKEYEEKQKSADEREKRCAHLSWLRSARENYISLMQAVPKHSWLTNLFLVIALASFAMTAVTIFLKSRFAFLFLPLWAISWVIYEYSRRRMLSVSYKEIEKIKEEFRRRFGKEITDIATLDSFLQEQNSIAGELNAIRNELTNLEAKISEARSVIKAGFRKMVSSDVSEYDWANKLSELTANRKEAMQRIKEASESLARLDVDEKEYEEVATDIEFSKTEFEELDSKYKELTQLKRDEVEKEGDIKETNEKLHRLRGEIDECFKKVGRPDVEESEWKQELTKIKRQNEELKRDLVQKQGELAGLGVQQAEYLDSDPGVVFSQQELEDIEKKLDENKEAIENEHKALDQLKGTLCGIAGVDMDITWPKLIDALYSKRDEKQKELAEVEANIIAGKVLNDTITELYREEDEKIEERINSQEIADFVFRLTNRYKRLSLDQSQLVVSDDFNDFHFKDLSTGAKEQIMLALRVGFVSKVLGHQNGFLILDDAFQHSDYERRPILVDSLFDLASHGWQIIYLTMDDHIRALFEARSCSKEVSFKQINL